MSTTTTPTVENEATILARILANEDGQLPPELARYILDLKFSDRDKARMHDLAVRNQSNGLSDAETQELLAFGSVGDILAILEIESSPNARRQARNPAKRLNHP
jgi:hypothetical protein